MSKKNKNDKKKPWWKKKWGKVGIGSVILAIIVALAPGLPQAIIGYASDRENNNEEIEKEMRNQLDSIKPTYVSLTLENDSSMLRLILTNFSKTKTSIRNIQLQTLDSFGQADFMVKHQASWDHNTTETELFIDELGDTVQITPSPRNMNPREDGEYRLWIKNTRLKRVLKKGTMFCWVTFKNGEESLLVPVFIRPPENDYGLKSNPIVGFEKVIQTINNAVVQEPYN